MDNISYVPAKTIITRAKSDGWFGMDYNMNIYRGCSHGCIYCDSRSECYHIDDFDNVAVKQSALEIIGRELHAKRVKGVVATGAMSDPYNPLERELGLTRGALQLIDRHGFGAAIATKSPLIARDADILASIARHSPVIAKITVTTIDDALCRRVEPHVAPGSARLEAVRQLSERGVFCGLLMMPLLPFINDNPENVLGIVRAAHQAGARFIYPSFGVTLRMNQREYFYSRLDKGFPGVSARYRAKYGERYYCASARQKELWAAFAAECNKLGLEYEMPRIIAAYKLRYTAEQTRLF